MCLSFWIDLLSVRSIVRLDWYSFFSFSDKSLFSVGLSGPRIAFSALCFLFNSWLYLMLSYL